MTVNRPGLTSWYEPMPYASMIDWKPSVNLLVRWNVGGVLVVRSSCRRALTAVPAFSCGHGDDAVSEGASEEGRYRERERAGTHRGAAQRSLHGGDVPRRDPPLGDERLPALVPLPQVERRKHDLLLAHEGPPRRDRVGNLDELGAPRLVRVVQDRREVLDARRHLAQLVRALVGRRVDREQGRTHRCAHPARSSQLAQPEGVREHDKGREGRGSTHTRQSCGSCRAGPGRAQR